MMEWQDIESAQFTHDVTDEGELTANWFCQKSKFWGTPDQLLRCARCGVYDRKGHHDRVRFRDIGKPTLHRLCDECHDALPE